MFGFLKRQKIPRKNEVRTPERVTPVLVLDFDGVLHIQQRGTLDKLPLIEDLLRRRTELQLVISSTWRMQHSLSELRDYFSEDIRDRVEGAIPFLNKLPYTRHTEIVAYFEGNNARRWCALDDEAVIFPPDCPQLVLTDPLVGVTADNIAAVERKLFSPAAS